MKVRGARHVPSFACRDFEKAMASSTIFSRLFGATPFFWASAATFVPRR